ncbi:MAG TPA: hypothetical protein VFA56_08260 [Gaiellaceae bacterium]|nr:hypothetical protein [Gaiellaceae bacterium]
MDRRPLGAPLREDRRRDGLARAEAVASGARIARRLIAAGVAVALAAALATWLVLRQRPPERTQPHAGLLVGVDDDTLKWTAHPLAVVRWQRALGARAVRVWVPWSGERAPSGARRDELARAEQAARRTSVVLAVFGFARSTPSTPRGRARYCGYARRVLDLVPDARAIVVWNEANSPTYWHGTPSTYAALLARCYDELHRRGLTVLDSTASAHEPERFLERVGEAYRKSGRTRPLVDAFGHNPYPASDDEPPAATHARGFLGIGDYARLARVIRSSFGRPYDVWYLEDGYQSSVPRPLARRYSGRENVGVVAPSVQARRLADAIALAACQHGVRAFFNFELVDETRLAGWQSGLVWRGVHRKPAARAFARAARSAASGCGTRP